MLTNWNIVAGYLLSGSANTGNLKFWREIKNFKKIVKIFKEKGSFHFSHACIYSSGNQWAKDHLGLAADIPDRNIRRKSKKNFARQRQKFPKFKNCLTIYTLERKNACHMFLVTKSILGSYVRPLTEGKLLNAVAQRLSKNCLLHPPFPNLVGLSWCWSFLFSFRHNV